MTTYNNQIEIVLFANNRANGNPKAPSKTGTVTFPDGTKYDVALWSRVSGKGTPFESGTLRLPDPKYARNNEGGGYQGQNNQAPAGGAAPVDF
jgi:hypothetical protein